MVKTAIFLGAGASKAEGAPLQGDLFCQYFSSDLFRPDDDEMDRELANFFLRMFGIDVGSVDVSTIQFPTFEEVLGLTDLAILRKEAFRQFDLEKKDINSGCLRSIAKSLIFLVAKVLHEKLQRGMGLHRRLIKILHDGGYPA